MSLITFGRCIKCASIHKMARIFVIMISVIVTDIQQFSNKETKNIGTVEQYSYKNILCEFKGPCEPSQDCKFLWKRGLGTATSIVETDRLAVDREGTIHFLYVELEDAATYASPIACGITLESARAFYKGGPIIMSIVPKSSVPLSQPRGRYSADVTGLLGGQATLECIFSGYPKPAITWYKPNNQKIMPNNKKNTTSFESYGRKLVIKNLQEDDEGEYRCEADNSAGSGGATVLLNVTSKPILKDGAPESLVVPGGENAVFTCRMSSLKNERPPTAPKWYINGEELPASQIGSSDSHKYQLSADKTELTVKHVTNQGDTCSFMCIAGNVIADDNGRHRFMETYAGATLIVIEPIDVTVISKTSIELFTTAPCSLAVSATTDKTIKSLMYEWIFTRSDNTTLYGNAALEGAPWVLFNGISNLTIVPENVTADRDYDKVREVTGTYQVHIYHKYQSKYVKFVVFTNLQPEAEVGFDLWIIGVILGVIVLLIIACIVCRKRVREHLGKVGKKEMAARHDQEKELTEIGFADFSRAGGEQTPFDKIVCSDDALETEENSLMGDFPVRNDMAESH